MPIPRTDDELHDAVKDYIGISIPRTPCCPDLGHTSPFHAFSDAFFSRNRVSVWHSSRGYGGKSVLLATLGFAEAVFLGAPVAVLGGSGEQAERVHSYMNGHHSNLPNTFWKHPNAPTYLLTSDPTKRITKLNNGAEVKVLMASQRSVRGLHNQKLLCDEIDEMELEILDGALGQPQGARGIPVQIVLSSTFHHADGTMAEVLRRVAEIDKYSYTLYRWCWKANLESNGGWLPQSEVDAKRKEVTAQMFDSEYDLQEPNPGERAFDPGKVESMFRRELGEYSGDEPWLQFEPYDESGYYVTGADWARKRDSTIIQSWRTDVSPMRLVAYSCMGRVAWPNMTSMFDQHVMTYPGYAGHDATGLGDVVAGFISVPAYGFILQGKMRYNVLNGYIGAVERGQYAAPMIRRMYNEHKRASRADLFGTGEHLPDTVCAAAIANAITGTTGWVMGMAN